MWAHGIKHEKKSIFVQIEKSFGKKYSLDTYVSISFVTCLLAMYNCCIVLVKDQISYINQAYIPFIYIYVPIETSKICMYYIGWYNFFIR